MKFYIFKKDYIWHAYIQDEHNNIISEHTFDSDVETDNIINLVKILSKLSNIETYVNFTNQKEEN